MSLKLEFFDENDFKCKCGCGLDAQPSLKRRADRLRRSLGYPIIINSGARCEAYNRLVGGAPASQHLKGLAMDVTTTAPRGMLVYVAVKEMFSGFGFYRNFTHLDIGPPRYWEG